MNAGSTDRELVAVRPEPVLLDELHAVDCFIRDAVANTFDTSFIATYQANRQRLAWELAFSRIADFGVDLTSANRPPDAFIKELDKACRDGDLALAAGQLDDAIKGYRTSAANLSNDTHNATLCRAILYYFAREYDEAIQILTDPPQRPDAWVDGLWRSVQRQAAIGVRMLQLFRTNHDRVREQVENDLADCLGGLLERFSATSGWIFVPSNDGKHLVPLSSQNSRRVATGESIPIEKGLSGWAWRNGISYLAEDVNDDRHKAHYIAWEPETESAVAVPISSSFPNSRGAPQGDTPIAVLCLESQNKNNFSAGMLWELESLTRTFVPNLVIYRGMTTEEQGSASPFAWHYRLHAWNLTELMKAVCHSLSWIFAGLESPATRDSDSLYPSCTVWNFDEQSHSLWVHATARFDFEYVAALRLREKSRTDKTSPNPAAETPDPSREIANSLTGCAVWRPRGSSLSDDWYHFPQFHRREKARRMGLSRITSIPLGATAGDKPAHGVFNCYSFHNNRHPPQSILRHAADLISGQLRQHAESVEEIAASWVRSELLHRKCLDPKTSLRRMQDAICEMFAAAACSIFALDDTSEPHWLKCVTSTGLTRSAPEVGKSAKPTYDVRDPESHTVACWRQRKSYRSNFVPRDRSVFSFRAERKWIETLDASETDHRRVLIASVPAKDGKDRDHIGVIRVIRTSDDPPFVANDERILKAVAFAASEPIETWRMIRHSKKAVHKTVKEIISARNRGENTEVPENAVAQAKRRKQAVRLIVDPVSTHTAPSRPLIDEVLTSLLRYFEADGVVHCNLREACLKPNGEQYLRLVEFHSVYTPEWPDEAAYPLATANAGSISLHCLENHRVGVFRFLKPDEHDGLKATSFAPINDDSTKVESGVCVPFRTFTGGKTAEWVMSIDFATRPDWEHRPKDFEVIIRAAAKLGAIVTNGRVIRFESPRDVARDFLKDTIRHFGGQAGKLDLLWKTPREDPRPIPVYMKHDDVQLKDEWSRFDDFVTSQRTTQADERERDLIDSFDRLGVQCQGSTVDGHEQVTVKLPLIYGPDVAGGILCTYDRQRTFLDGLKQSLKPATRFAEKWTNLVLSPESADMRWSIASPVWKEDARFGEELVYATEIQPRLLADIEDEMIHVPDHRK